MPIVNLQQDDLASTPPQNQPRLFAVRVHCKRVGNNISAVPRAWLEIETGTPAFASIQDIQFVNRADSIGGHISNCRMIENPSHYGCLRC